MIFLLKHFIKRLRRDGVKSLSVPLVAFILVLLINLLGAVREQLSTEYEDMMENFPILARLSDHSGTNLDELNITESFMNIFVDPAHPLSLYEFTSSIALRRTLEIVEIGGEAANAQADADIAAETPEDGPIVIDADTDWGAELGEISDDGVISEIWGITNVSMLYPMMEEHEFSITFFDGYDESLFGLDEIAFVISEHLLDFVYDNYLEISFRSVNPGVAVAALIDTVDTAIRVVGTVSGVEDNLVIGSFSAVTEMGNESDGLQAYSELLHMTVAENSELSRLKSMATNSFAPVRPVLSSLRFSMTIYDSEFIEMLEPLRQNIILIDVATPFIFIISVAVGFLTSTLLTRQRMSEYAIMRSVGVRRYGIFFGALIEQASLSAVGAGIGFAFVLFTWDYMSYERPLIFLGCYVLGALFSASKAAGTDVMAILRNRE